MLLFHHETGPAVQYYGGMLEVSDLNPEVRARWVMSRWEMLCLGWNCIVAAVMG